MDEPLGEVVPLIKYLAQTQAQAPEFGSKASMQKSCVAVHTCGPRDGRMETGGSMELTDHPASPDLPASGSALEIRWREIEEEI